MGTPPVLAHHPFLHIHYAGGTMPNAVLRVAMLVVGILWLQIGFAQTWPESGWWWTPSESGRGVYIEQQGNTLFMAIYFYDTDGRPTWLVSAGGFSDPMNYTGRLLSVGGGQTLMGDYKAPTEVDAGEVTLSFTDRTHGTMTWPGGATPILRQVWNADLSAFNPNGWWWNPDQSGRGFAIEVQGGTAVMAAFMYDDQGKPVWYLAYGPMTTPIHFEGTWSKFSNGQAMGGVYKEPTESLFGSVSIDWASTDEATLTWTDQLPLASPSDSKAGAHAKTCMITPKGCVIVTKVGRELPPKPTPPPPAWPSTWSGPFSQHYFFDHPVSGTTSNGSLNLHGFATWHEVDVAPPGGGSSYSVAGYVEVDWKWHTHSAFSDCTGDFYDAVSLSSSDGTLDIGANGLYSGKLKRDLPFTWTQTCTVQTQDGPRTETKVVTNDYMPLNIPLMGAVTNFAVEGTDKLYTSLYYTTLWDNWDFFPRP